MSKSIVFMGASGAVGSAALQSLLSHIRKPKLLLLGRRKLDVDMAQQIVDISDSTTYNGLISGFDTAICTLGVGEPSKESKAYFLKIDKIAVLDFAISCKKNGVKHFQLLSSVGVSLASRNFYLRTKAELIAALEELDFERLSIFQPAMILTPKNRYGFTQAIVLKVWPRLDFILKGNATKYRGIKVAELGKAIANNVFTTGSGTVYLQYDQFKELANNG